MNRLIFISGAFLVSTMIVGCSPEIDNRGYEIDTKNFTTIVPGVTTKQFIEENFGSPSTISTYPPEIWYYVSKVTSTKSFLPAKTIEQKSYAIEFDGAGVVKKVIERKGDEAREINPVKRSTPTVGQEQGLLREVFSNFGKIATQGGSRKP